MLVFVEPVPAADLGEVAEGATRATRPDAHGSAWPSLERLVVFVLRVHQDRPRFVYVRELPEILAGDLRQDRPPVNRKAPRVVALVDESKRSRERPAGDGVWLAQEVPVTRIEASPEHRARGLDRVAFAARSPLDEDEPQPPRSERDDPHKAVAHDHLHDDAPGIRVQQRA